MSAVHRKTLESIPWLINGRLGEDERRAFERHLHECAECRAEFAEQQRIHAAINRDSTRIDYAPGASLQKLWTRIEETDALHTDMPPRRTNAGAPRLRLAHWLAAAVIVEAVAITYLAVNMNADPSAPAPLAYRTVTTTEIVPQTAVLRAVFAADLSLDELNAILHKQQLTIVAGPSAAGVYTLATTAPLDQLPVTLPATLAALRAHPGVRFAETITNIESHP